MGRINAELRRGTGCDEKSVVIRKSYRLKPELRTWLNLEVTFVEEALGFAHYFHGQTFECD